MQRGLALFALIALTPGCDAGDPTATSSATDTGSPVVARVDGVAITAADLEGSVPRGRPLEPQRALDLVIARRLAAREAQRRGLDDANEIQAQLTALRREAEAREEALLRDALFASTRDTVALTEEDLRAHYEKTKVRRTERRLRLRRARFPSAEAAAAAEAKLGADGRLDPATSEEIGPAPIRKLPQTVLPEGLRLRAPGERILIERDGAAALVELVEILPAETRPFEEVRAQVERELRNVRGGEAFQRLLEGLRTQARIEVDEAALRAVPAGEQPPALRGPALRTRPRAGP